SRYPTTRVLNGVPVELAHTGSHHICIKATPHPLSSCLTVTPAQFRTVQKAFQGDRESTCVRDRDGQPRFPVHAYLGDARVKHRIHHRQTCQHCFQLGHTKCLASSH